MPILNPKPGVPVKPKPVIQQIAKPDYKGVTVDTTKTPVSHLLAHIEGSSWTVKYYSQVIGLDNQTAGNGAGNAAVHQQYKVINNMELKVTSPLSASQDPDTKEMSYVGSASIYPFIIPNEGDMFLASLADGREGVFQITNSDRLSIQKQSGHNVEYRMVNFSDTVILADMDKKVIENLYYDKDFLQNGQNPLLFEEEYHLVTWMRKNFYSIIERYTKSFFSREYSTMTLPAQEKPHYDAFLTRMITDTTTTWNSQELRFIRLLNTDEDEALRATSVWDALMRRDRTLLRQAFRQYGLVNTVTFHPDPMQESIRYSGIDWMIYPADPILSVDYKHVPPPKLISSQELQKAPVDMQGLSELLPMPKHLREEIAEVLQAFGLTDTNGNAVADLPIMPPSIHRAMADGYYVFSKAFYENSRVAGAQSVLELTVQDFLDGKAINVKRLKTLCEDIDNWNAMDRFYFVPVILILIRAVIRTTT